MLSVHNMVNALCSVGDPKCQFDKVIICFAIVVHSASNLQCSTVNTLILLIETIVFCQSASVGPSANLSSPWPSPSEIRKKASPLRVYNRHYMTYWTHRWEYSPYILGKRKTPEIIAYHVFRKIDQCLHSWHQPYPLDVVF